MKNAGSKKFVCMRWQRTIFLTPLNVKNVSPALDF